MSDTSSSALNKRPVYSATITLGSIIAAITAAFSFIPIVWLILYFGDLNNDNITQDGRMGRIETSIATIQASIFTDEEAQAARERRDAQIEGIQRVQDAQQKGFDVAFDGMKGRLDRVFERLDAMSTTITELKTTIQIMNRQSFNNRGLFDRGGGPIEPSAASPTAR